MQDNLIVRQSLSSRPADVGANLIISVLVTSNYSSTRAQSDINIRFTWVGNKTLEFAL